MSRMALALSCTRLGEGCPLGSSTTKAVVPGSRWFSHPVALPGYRGSRAAGRSTSRARVGAASLSAFARFGFLPARPHGYSRLRAPDGTRRDLLMCRATPVDRRRTWPTVVLRASPPHPPLVVRVVPVARLQAAESARPTLARSRLTRHGARTRSRYP